MQYTSKSQLARISTESWVAENGYCLACESDRIVATRANTEARDFECSHCGHPYELKSSIRKFGNTLVDGAYDSMMRRLDSNTVASFLLLRHMPPVGVLELLVIHRSLITYDVVKKRNALSSTARRAGWVGCNILLSGIPSEGRIHLIRDGLPLPKERSRTIFQATDKLSSESIANRNWSRVVLNCLHRLSGSRFTLSQVYSFEPELSRLFPANHNVRAKIRQQLQVLRDAGILTFEGHGEYQLKLAAYENEDYLYV
jgi:type II restriction enzyme